MPPWEELRWFLFPTAFTVTAGPTGSAKRLVPRNPMRATLLISSASGGGFSLGTDPAVTSSTGILIPSNTAPLIFNVHNHPGLVQSEWWVFSSVGVTVAALETQFRDWPRPDVPTLPIPGERGDLEQQARIAGQRDRLLRLQEAVRRLNDGRYAR